MDKKRVIIMGAAGRDFHNFNVYYRNNPAYEVRAFTATQIPDIHDRRYPPVLSGPDYPGGIPIYLEEKLTELIKKEKIDEVVFSYSDVSHEYVMHKASEVLAAGADFRLLGYNNTAIKANVPVISVCAVRTGVGKSQTTRRISEILANAGLRPVAVRHPMPYGDLSKQVCQRFASTDDLVRYNCTIEEVEEYFPHIERGNVVYAGVDYEAILKEAEKEADVIIWDGGNNDLPFYRSDFHIVLVDPLRPGHEICYHPGEANLRMADCVIINKIDSATPDNIEIVKGNVRACNPGAVVIEAASPITVSDPGLISGKRVLAVEDGPTLTHGGMPYGAGVIASKNWGAKEIIDPRPYAVGSLREVYKKFKHLGPLLPAMGYSDRQVAELKETIDSVPCDVVVIGTPIDLRKLINFDRPAVRVGYELEERTHPNLEDCLVRVLKEKTARHADTTSN
ncbi:MAG: cyclic 2,3-diphosphoglycerate synthase [Chloroflexi bacterium]|nr:cyclic 2,3-diphosphoglycerate synthase [Chloroflexota bacterium]